MEKVNWFEAFKKGMNVYFTKKDFKKYKSMIKKELKLYKKYLKPGAKILDIGCGLGCTAVPLSTYGYKVTGIDNDKKVIEAAKKNAKKFGKNIKIIYGDIFNIDKLFNKDSFDACISGGVLEHFPKNKIRNIVNKQLYLAPIVIASMPIATEDVKKEYKDYKKKICKDGIYRNLWKPDYWIKNILNGYNILEYSIGKASKAIGGFDEIIVIIGRTQT